jgi:hypothetical protein
VVKIRDTESERVLFLHRCTGDYEDRDYWVVRSQSMEGIASLGLSTYGPCPTLDGIARWVLGETNDENFLFYHPEEVRAILDETYVMRIWRELTPKSDPKRVLRSMLGLAKRHPKLAVRCTFFGKGIEGFEHYFASYNNEQDVDKVLTEHNLLSSSGATPE